MSRATLFLAMLLAGCGGSSASSEEPIEETTDTTGGTTEVTAEPTGEETAEAPPEPAGPSPAEICTQAMTRERECADAFLPALVDLRIRLDNPAGTARSGRNARGRNRLLATARTEFETDSTDERIAAQCQEFAAMPAEQTGPMVEMMQGCLGQTECAEFVTCDMQVQERRLTAGAPAATETPSE